jgi:hypothetical protein
MVHLLIKYFDLYDTIFIVYSSRDHLHFVKSIILLIKYLDIYDIIFIVYSLGDNFHFVKSINLILLFHFWSSLNC